MTHAPRPLDGVRVVEFSHMVMGPTCGLILADLGADVVKVEPAPEGDKTRRLPGSGSGFFGTYNRNKRSISVNLKSVEGLEFAIQLVRASDVLLENFGAGVLDRLGLGYEAIQKINPSLVYCALKGFLSGPYEQRAALDEVVQMMGGLAYMTGPEGQPLRAGASVNDVMGGLFGVVAIQAGSASAPAKALLSAWVCSRTTCSSSGNTWCSTAKPEFPQCRCPSVCLPGLYMTYSRRLTVRRFLSAWSVTSSGSNSAKLSAWTICFRT
jgi:hypothetical protein